MKNQIVKDYDQESFKKKLTQIQALLKGNDISNVTIAVSSTYYNKFEGPFKMEKNIGCIVKVPIEEIEKAYKLRELVENEKLVEGFEIDCAVGVGQKFWPIKGSDKAEGDEEDITISHTPGKVLLVDFWATWCGPCQQPMAHNQQMLVKNEAAWKDKVSIVGLSLDSDKNTLVKRINDRGWKSVDQYILPGNWKHPAPQMYVRNGIPHVLLVDKQGTIVYSEHPESIDLEAKINELITAPALDGEAKEASAITTSSTDEPKNKSDSLSAEEFKNIKKAIKEGTLNSLMNLRGEKDVLSLVGFINRTKCFDKDFKLVRTDITEFIIRAYVLQSGKEKIEQKIKDLALESVCLEIDVMETTKLTFGSKCSSCSKALTNADPQYFSHQDNLHFCKDCGDKTDESKVGTAKFVNANPLIYLNFKDPAFLEDVLTHRIGQQEQPKTIKEEAAVKLHRGVSCNICGKAVADRPRWKCLNCQKFDICDHCVDTAEKGDASVVEKSNISVFEKIDNLDDHKATHVLQRFCFIQA